MMRGVELVRMPVIFVAAVAGTGTEEQVHPVPQELERAGMPVHGRRDAANVVQVFGGTHAQTGEWFNIGIAMVKGVYVLVEAPQVQQSMNKEEVNDAKNGNKNCCQKEFEDFFFLREGRRIGCKNA